MPVTFNNPESNKIDLEAADTLAADSISARIAAIQTSTTDVTAIRAVTDNLPDSGALTSISDETDKIDGALTDGLTGVNNSLAYRVHEIEKHFHSYESWFGVAAAPNGEIHVADRIGADAFQIDGGNDTWGTWVQVLGSSDTPARSGMAKFDLHRVQMVAVERTNATHFMQIALGTSGAAAYAAGEYTEFVFHPQNVQAQEVPVPVMDERKDDGTKAWMRVWVDGQDTGTVDFYIGLHEYVG